MRRFVDTNYLLRYMLADNDKMHKVATNIIQTEQAATRPESILECIYVLQMVYGLERKEIASALETLLEEVAVAESDVIRDALSIYGSSSLDYVDCIYIAISKKSGQRVLSFDKKMNNMMDRIGIPKS